MRKKIYDKSGKWVGTETKDWLGNDVIKDRDGKVQNYLGKDALGNSVVRDRNGKVQSYLGEDMLGNRVTRDRDGKKTGYLGTKDAFGNSVFRNADGKVTGYYDLAGKGKGGFFGTDNSSSKSGSNYTAGNYSAGNYSDNSYNDPYAASYNAAMRAAYAPVHLTPQQKRLGQKNTSLFNWGLACYALPIIYVFIGLFVHSLPLSFSAMVLMLTVGTFLGELFSGASDTAFELVEQLVVLFVPSLAYVLRVAWSPVHSATWSSEQLYRLFRRVKGTTAVFLGGPILFLVAAIVGIILGKLMKERVQKKFLNSDTPLKLTALELVGKFICVWLSALFGMLVTASVMVVWFVALRWGIYNLIPRFGSFQQAFLNNSFAVSVVIALIGTVVIMPIGKVFVQASNKIHPPKNGARYIAIAAISFLSACFFFIGWKHGALPFTLSSLQSRLQSGAWFCAAYGMVVYACKFIAAAIRMHNGGKLLKKTAKKN